MIEDERSKHRRQLHRRNTGEAIAFSGYIVDELSWREHIIVSPGIRIERYEMGRLID